MELWPNLSTYSVSTAATVKLGNKYFHNQPLKREAKFRISTSASISFLIFFSFPNSGGVHMETRPVPLLTLGPPLYLPRLTSILNVGDLESMWKRKNDKLKLKTNNRKAIEYFFK